LLSFLSDPLCTAMPERRAGKSYVVALAARVEFLENALQAVLWQTPGVWAQACYAGEPKVVETIMRVPEFVEVPNETYVHKLKLLEKELEQQQMETKKLRQMNMELECGREKDVDGQQNEILAKHLVQLQTEMTKLRQTNEDLVMKCEEFEKNAGELFTLEQVQATVDKEVKKCEGGFNDSFLARSDAIAQSAAAAAREEVRALYEKRLEELYQEIKSLKTARRGAESRRAAS